MQLKFYVTTVVLVLVFTGTANSQIGGGYSLLTLDSPNKDNFHGFEMRLRLPMDHVDKNTGGIQTSLAIHAATYGGNAHTNSYEISNLSDFGVGLELASYFKLAGINGFIVPSVDAGGTMAYYNSTHIISPYLLDKKEERAFGWMAHVGLAYATDQAGIEVSYGWNGIDFNNSANGIHRQLYVGLFVRF